MIIQGNGLQLTRLNGGDIEMLRKWRNSPGIKRHMIFKGQITPEMQQQWFRGVDNICNHYFIITVRRKKIGLVKISNINFSERDAEAGIFIQDNEFIGSRIPVIAMLILFDFAFHFLSLKQLYGYVLKGNNRSIAFHEKLGSHISGSRAEGQLTLTCTREGHDSCCRGLRQALFSRGKYNEPVKVITDLHDTGNGLAAYLTALYEKLPIHSKEMYAMIKGV